MSCGLDDSPEPSAVKHNVDEKNRKRFESDKSKVLVYDAEDGDSTRRFIEAFKKLLNADFEIKDFDKANNEENDTLPIIAVVRHTSIRIEECLRQTDERLQDKIKDMKRVIIIYVCMNETENEEVSDTINFLTKSQKFNFAKVVQMDFSHFNLELTGIEFFKSLLQPNLSFTQLKEINKIAKMELKKCLKETDVSVHVYFAMDEQLVRCFIAELRQSVSSSICIQEAQPIGELEYVTASTLIFATEHVNFYREKKLIINDWKKVILIIVSPRSTPMGHAKQYNPNSTENSFTIPKQVSLDSTMLNVNTINNNAAQHAENESCQQYREIWEVINNNGKFHTPMTFLNDFVKFVRMHSL